MLSCLRSGSSALKNASNAGKCMTIGKFALPDVIDTCGGMVKEK